jgi:hypothetical protein
MSRLFVQLLRHALAPVARQLGNEVADAIRHRGHVAAIILPPAGPRRPANPRPAGPARDIYNVSPGDLKAREEAVNRLAWEWQQTGGVWVSDKQVNDAENRVRGLHAELKKADEQSRLTFRLRYLAAVKSGHVIILFASLVAVIYLALLVASQGLLPANASGLAAVLISVAGASATGFGLLVLWPNEANTQDFDRADRQRQVALMRLADTRNELELASADFSSLEGRWCLHSRLKVARQRRDEIAQTLASAQYQLIHLDWRSMRGKQFEDSLEQAFRTLGYGVERKAGPWEHGADLLVSRNGMRVAVQAKGYENGVGPESVRQAFSGQHAHGCNFCVAIANSYFTPVAEELADKLGCQLINGNQIRKLIEGRIPLTA